MRCLLAAAACRSLLRRLQQAASLKRTFASRRSFTRPLPGGSWVWRDIQYYPLTPHELDEEPHAKHCLDVYISSTTSYPKRPSPVVLFVHGGSWVRGDRQHTLTPLLYDNVGGVCARNDFVGVVMSYRLAPAAQHPEHARDVARTIRWIRRSIRRYGGDPDSLFLCGHSAGAHLCAFLLCDETLLTEEEVTDAHDFVKGFLGISGVFNLERLSRSSPFVRLGPVFGDDAEALDRASPAHLVARASKPLLMDKVPILLLNAQADFHLRDDSLELLRLLASRESSRGVPREAVIVPGTNHISIITAVGHMPQGKTVEELVTKFVSTFAVPIAAPPPPA